MTAEIYNFRNWLPFIASIEQENYTLGFTERMESLRRRLSSDVSEYLGHRLYPIDRMRNSDRVDQPWYICIMILTRRLRGRDPSIKGEAYDVDSWIESFRNQELDSNELWTILSIQRTRCVIGGPDQVYRFWNAHSLEAQKRLEDLSPFFNPEHEVWPNLGEKGFEYIKKRRDILQSLRVQNKKLLYDPHKEREFGFVEAVDQFTPGLLLLELDICDKTISSEPMVQALSKDGHASGSSGKARLAEVDETVETPTPDGPKEETDNSMTPPTDALEQPMTREVLNEMLELSEAESTNASEELALPSADWAVIN